MIEPDGTPGGRLVLTADQYAVLTEPATRLAVASLVPAVVMLGVPAETDDGLLVYDDPRLTGGDVDTVLYLLDNPAVLDAIAAEAPDDPS
jgi:hypothetical protein